MFSPWDYGKPNRDKVNKNINQSPETAQEAGEEMKRERKHPHSEPEEDQDDAFHRWLTSTEKNNKNNGPQLVDADDFEGDDKNYENIDIDIDAVSSLQATAKIPMPTTPSIGGYARKPAEEEEENQQQQQQLEQEQELSQQLERNSGQLKYEINFSDNPNGYPSNGATDNSNSDINNSPGNDNDNLSPFSNPYQNYNKNNNNNNNNSPTLNNRLVGVKSQRGNNVGTGSSGPLSSSSGTSNEDNNVAGVVNIDIMLTAAADIAQQQQEQQQQTDSARDQQQLLVQSVDPGRPLSQQQGQTNAKQKSLLISNTNAKDNELLSPFSGPYSSMGNANNSSNSISFSSVGGQSLQQTLSSGGYLFSSNFNRNTSNSNSSNDSFKLSQSLVSNPNATSPVVVAASSASSSASSFDSSAAQTTPTPMSTTLSPERQCNVMGKFTLLFVSTNNGQ